MSSKMYIFSFSSQWDSESGMYHIDSCKRILPRTIRNIFVRSVSSTTWLTFPYLLQLSWYDLLPFFYSLFSLLFWNLRNEYFTICHWNPVLKMSFGLFQDVSRLVIMIIIQLIQYSYWWSSSWLNDHLYDNFLFPCVYLDVRFFSARMIFFLIFFTSIFS